MLTSSSPSNDCRFLQVCYVTGAPLQLASRLNGFFRNFFFCESVTQANQRVKATTYFSRKIWKASRATTKKSSSEIKFFFVKLVGSWTNNATFNHSCCMRVYVCSFFFVACSFPQQPQKNVPAIFSRPAPPIFQAPPPPFLCLSHFLYLSRLSIISWSLENGKIKSRTCTIFAPFFFMFYFARVTRITKVL